MSVNIPKPSFRVWLSSQRHRKDAVGRFAKEANNDGNAAEWPTREGCIGDLSTRNAARHWVNAAHQAWDEFDIAD